MADTEKAPQTQTQEPEEQQTTTTTALKNKQLIAEKVTGTVKWFNVKSGYGFINRNDTKEDVFVHQTAIARNNPRKIVRSVGDGESVEFDVVSGDKGFEAFGVTGPGGEPVKGSPYAADKPRGYYRRFYPRGGRGGENTPRRGTGRRGPAPTGAVPEEGQDENAAPPPQRIYRRNFRGRRGGANGTTRGGFRRPKRNPDQTQNDNPEETPQNGQDASPTNKGKPKANGKPTGTTIETTTNESQA